MKVYLNVYDITHFNRYISILGLNAFHSGIEVNNVEYAYGYNFDDTTGVCRSIPGYHAKFVLKERLFLGETLKTKKEIEAVIEEISEEFLGKDYHLLLKNCNHFSDFLAKNLVGKGIPSRVNRISQVGHCLSCILPPSIWKSALLEEVPIKPQTCQWYS